MSAPTAELFSDLAGLEDRELSGFGNNEAEPDLGTAGSPLLRLSPANYADGVGAVEEREAPREISNIVVHQEEPVPNSAGVNALWIFQGQIVDHDTAFSIEDRSDVITTPVPADDPVFGEDGLGFEELELERSVVAEGTGIVAEDGTPIPREQTTVLSSFIDASNVYGSDAAVGDLLRERNADGTLSPFLATGEGDNLPTLEQLAARDGLDLHDPADADGIDALLQTGISDLVASPTPSPDPQTLVAGDARASENIALSVIHTVWLREHNHQVERLIDSGAAEGMGDDEIYDVAKLIVEAEMQQVVFNEWLPLLVGEENIPAFEGYDPSVDPTIANEFAAAAFRMGHTFLPPILPRREEDGSEIAAGDAEPFMAFFNPAELHAGGGVDPLVRGLAGTVTQEGDQEIVDDVRNLLFGPPDNLAVRDLAVLNILRAREHGIPPLNDVREAIGLEPFEDFSDITSDPELAAELDEAYESIDTVDLWVGGLSEDDVPGSQLGETLTTIIVDQFVRARDGDRFYFEERLADQPELLAEIKDTGFSDIILRNTDVEHLQDDAFIAHERIAGGAGDDMLVGTADPDLLIGFDGEDTLAAGDGDDDLFGGAAADVLMGEAGDDVLDGGAAADTLVGGAGDDELRGGGGDDVHALGGPGDRNTVIYDEGGNDVVADFDVDGGDETTFDVLEIRTGELDVVLDHAEDFLDLATRLEEDEDDGTDAIVDLDALDLILVLARNGADAEDSITLTDAAGTDDLPLEALAAAGVDADAAGAELADVLMA